MAECEDLDDEMESVLDPLGLLSSDDENHRFHVTDSVRLKPDSIQRLRVRNPL